MFKTFRFTRKVENTLMFIFIGLFLAFCCCLSPDMSIESLKSVVLIGITVGIIYGLVAVGISLIYTGLDIVNFTRLDSDTIGYILDHGEAKVFIVDGELIYAIFPEAYGWIGYVIGLFFAFVVMGLFGVLVERLFFRPLTRKGGGYTVAGMGIIICGFGMSVVLQNLAYLIWKPISAPFNAELGMPINISGLTLPMPYVWMLVTGLIVSAALYFFLNKTKMGLGVRAVAHSKDISNLVGINVPLYISITFGIACAIAGVAGTLVGPTYQVVIYMGYIILLKAFASAVVGGFGSLPGAIVGGFTVGLFETMGSYYISGSHKDAFAFILMILVLQFQLVFLVSQLK